MQTKYSPKLNETKCQVLCKKSLTITHPKYCIFILKKSTHSYISNCGFFIVVVCFSFCAVPRNWYILRNMEPFFFHTSGHCLDIAVPSRMVHTHWGTFRMCTTGTLSLSTVCKTLIGQDKLDWQIP